METKSNLIISPLLFLIFIGCFSGGFIKKKIVGNFYLTNGETTITVNLSYIKKGTDQSAHDIITDSIIEVLWNEHYIVVTQHPVNYSKVVIDNFYEHAFDSLSSCGKKSNINALSFALSRQKYSQLKNELSSSKVKSYQKPNTLYHLINVQKEFALSTIFFSKHQLDSTLTALDVGRLEKIKWEGPFGQVYLP